MGKYFTDQYSLLHLASGIIAYFWGVSLWNWTLIHIIFELFENTSDGMYVINNWFKNIWPGGKTRNDTSVNSFGDIIYGTIGWILAYYVDRLSVKYELFPKEYF